VGGALVCCAFSLWRTKGGANICWMRAGIGERAMELMAHRALGRVAFGRPIAEQGAFRKELAQHRIQLEAARCLPMSCHTACCFISMKGGLC
jgi:acyl-CoA dehydrogenase